MAVTLGVVAIVSLLAAVLGACISLGVYRGYLHRIQKQQIAWERAREGHQHAWEIKQEKQLVQREARLSQQVLQVQQAWNAWEAGDKQRLEELQNQHQAIEAQLHLQNELARLPRVEEVPVSPQADPLQQMPANWRPPQLQASKLSGQDLAHRYLAHADLRNAELAHTNFFMADLNGAILTGARLEGADLSGANLTGADLRGATLTGANLLVADLRATILLGANLLGVRNLTPEQIGTAVCDNTTLLGAELDNGGPDLNETQKIPAVPSAENGSFAATLPATPPTTSYPEDLWRKEAKFSSREELPLLSSLLAAGGSPKGADDQEAADSPGQARQKYLIQPPSGQDITAKHQ